MDSVTLSLEQVYTLAFESLKTQGLSVNQAEAIAKTVMQAERDECAAHRQGRHDHRGRQRGFGKDRLVSGRYLSTALSE